MKKLLLTLCLVGFSTSALAEKILCVDKQHKAHTVQFIGDDIDIAYVDKIGYSFKSENDTPDGKVITYTIGTKDVLFVVNPEKREFFHLISITLPTKKNQKELVNYVALCDNVNIIEEEPKPVLINFK